MPVPTNISPATALLITALPFSVTLDAQLVPADTLWFRYDKVAGGNTVIVLAQPVPATGGYFPHLEAFYDNGGGLQPFFITGTAVPVTTPIDGFPTFYWSVAQSGGAFTDQLQFDAVAGPVAAGPTGSYVVNDDNSGLPVAIVDTGSGTVLQQRPFPAGERADVLPVTGESLWQDIATDTVKLYDNQFVLLATLTWDRLEAPGVEPPISSNHDDLFYVAAPGITGLGTLARVRTVTTAGAWGPTTWELPVAPLRAIAVSNDDAILYYTSAAGATAPIARWDLVGNVPLSDLVVLPATFTLGKDLLVLGDGSVVTYHRPGPFGAFVIERYSAAGGFLRSYSYDAGWNLNRMAYRDATTFLAWYFSDPRSLGLARFVVFRASDGAVLSVTETPVSVNGAWAGPNPGTPQTAIGESCPVILLPPPGLPPLTFGAPVAEPGSYTITGFDTAEPASGLRASPQRRLRRAPHLADEQRWLTYDRFQLDLQTGVGLNTGQGSDPQIMLRWSNDGGHTWSHEHWVSAGRMGATKTRAIWRQLGRARTRTFEVVVSDPCAFFLCAAYLSVSEGNS